MTTDLVPAGITEKRPFSRFAKKQRCGELLVLPGESELVASVPRQGVDIGEEGGLLHFLPQERVEGGQGGLVDVVDVSRPDLKFVIFSSQMYFELIFSPHESA